MKNSGKCPKCGGSDIVFIVNDGHPDASHGNNIQTGLTILAGVINIRRYICCSCGYTEEWIEQSDISMLLNSKKANRN